MAGPPSAQDVADALAMTLEREEASGAPWCPPGDAAALRRWVTERSAPLGTGIRRVVRLARLMAIADGRDYTRFLYVRITALRTRLFRQALEEALAGGRLLASAVALSENGVRLREPALAPPEGTHDGFEIDFAQMPRLAALLDFLHNALGFSLVADLLAPLLVQGVPTNSANEVGRALHAALNAWLSDRLESTNHILQAQRIRAFLVSRGRLAPEAIDDERILLFWQTAAEVPDEERVDGFRLYRSVAGAMLRYRQALRDATAAKYLEAALGRGLEPANDELGAGQDETGFEPWRSPLKALALQPASHVKWLTRKEQHRLLNYLGGPAGENDSEISTEEDDSGSWKGGLAGEERFDVGFWLTLLRADVFGAAQASIVGRLRKRVSASEAIAQGAAPIDDDAYETSANAYADLRQQLHRESLAALAMLMEAGAAEAVILLDQLGGQQAVIALLGATASHSAPAADPDGKERVADSLDREIAPALRAAIADPNSVPEGAGRKVLLDALAATRKVSRAGFRQEDRADPEMLAALRAGAAVVFEVIHELDRLIAILSQKATTGDVAGDGARFLATFRNIYLSATDR